MSFGIVASSYVPVQTSGIVWPSLTTKADHFGFSVPSQKYLIDVTQAQRDTFLTNLAATGAGWLRLEIPSFVVSPAQGTWDWTNIDAIVASAKARNIRLFGMVTTLPAWSRSGQPWNYGPSTTAQRTAFRDVIVAAAQRYNGDVEAWEVWNEPNLAAFWTSPSTTDYQALIAMVYPALRAVTNVPILSGGTGWGSTAPNIDTTTWYQTLHANGANQYWDGLTIHPYQDLGWARGGQLFKGGEYGRMTDLRAQMTNAGDANKPIYGTEFGWPAYPSGDGSHASYAEQAAWLAPTLDDWVARPYTGILFQHTLYDYTNSSSDLRGYGVYLEDEVTKKANFSELTTWIGDAAPAPTAFTEIFTTANGTAWDAAKWTTDTTAGPVDIQSNEGRLQLGAASTRSRAIAIQDKSADAEVLLSYRYDDITAGARSYLRVWLRGNGTWAATSQPISGYGIEIQSDVTTLRSYKSVDSVSTELLPSTNGPTPSTTKRWFRMRMQGTTLSYKVWLDGSSEPGSWTGQITGQSEITGTGVMQITTRMSSTATAPNAWRVDNINVTPL